MIRTSLFTSKKQNIFTKQFIQFDMTKITDEELKERQQWTWKQKVDHSLGVIDQFLSRTNGMAYVSYSGGKDSSVLLDLCRILKPNIKIVFFNTGMEFPAVINHIRNLKKEGLDIEIINPKQKPREIWEETGFPLISKEQAHKLWYMKNKPESKTAQVGFSDKGLHRVSKCWHFLAREKFDCNSLCCDILKKRPSHEYEKNTGLHPIVGTLATESLLRRQQYLLRGGCNSFKENKTFSTPLSIWTDDDIYTYIHEQNIKLPEVYYKGVKRTGCVVCGFGAHLEKDRYDILYRLYPKLYDHIMNYTNNGVTFREAIRKVLSIKGLYLPDENPELQMFGNLY